MNGYELVYEGPDSPQGKVWRITPLENMSALFVEFGATGSRLKSLTVPDARFRKLDIFQEMTRRIDEKIAKGYVIVKNDLPSRKLVTALTGQPDDGEAEEPIVIAYAAYSKVTDQEDFSKFMESVVGHLKEVFNDDAFPERTNVKPAETGIYVTVGDKEIYFSLQLGATIHDFSRLAGLCMASLASALPDRFTLTNGDGDIITPRELGMAVDDRPEVLEQFGIVRAVALSNAQPLGQWFF